MRKLVITGLLLLLSFLFSQTIFAARFWIAASSSNWNNTANWSATSGGAGGVSVPGAADDVNFDANGLGSCTVDIPVAVKSITVAAGYTGTISQGTNTISTVNAGSFSGGTFTGGSANITIGGTFTLNGTAFTEENNTCPDLFFLTGNSAGNPHSPYKSHSSFETAAPDIHF